MKLKRELRLDENGKKVECALYTCILSYLYKKDGRDIKGYKSCL